MRRVERLNVSHHTDECVMSHTEWVMAHVERSSPVYDWAMTPAVMSHIGMSNGVNASWWRVLGDDTSSCCSSICVTWHVIMLLTYMCDMTRHHVAHLYVWHDCGLGDDTSSWRIVSQSPSWRVMTRQKKLDSFIPPTNYFGCGFSAPYTLFCLICDMNSKYTTFQFPPIWVSRGRYPLVFSGQVRYPLGSKKLFVRLCDTTHS